MSHNSFKKSHADFLTYCNIIYLYRDQNFGINDLAAIQDVRNDFTLQDIDESTVSQDRGKLI